MRGFERIRTGRRLVSKKTLLMLVLIIGGITFLTFLYTSSVTKSSSAIRSSSQSEKIVVDKPFDLEAYVGNSIENKAPVTAVLKNVQKTGSITISGKKNTLKNGSTFVLLTFIIENNTSERLIFPTRDFVRYVDPNDKKFAPSISEKAIILEPQSTKIDTIGFVEPANIKTMKFAIGSLDKTKETIEVNFAN